MFNLLPTNTKLDQSPYLQNYDRTCPRFQGKILTLPSLASTFKAGPKKRGGVLCIELRTRETAGLASIGGSC